MASPTAASHTHRASATARDYLYRALYLRRELLLLATQTTAAVPGAEQSRPCSMSTANATTSPATPRTQDFEEVLLLPPLYGLDGLATAPPPSTEDVRTDPMLTLEHAWKGLVHVRQPVSPWYGGCFAFDVYFPSRYPFEPPIVELTPPLHSHPHLEERYTVKAINESDGSASAATGAGGLPMRSFIPFEETYAAVDPMRVSVMAVLLRHVRRTFVPSEWPPSWAAAAAAEAVPDGPPFISLVLTRRDVERRSVTQGVLLAQPLEQYLSTDVLLHFLEVWATSQQDKVSGNASNADWYTREVLPHLLHS